MENNLSVEKMTLKDLDKIYSILESEFDDFWNYNILKSELEKSNSVYLTCTKEYEIVGFAGITIILDTAELNNIVIKKSCRGKGYSSILLDNLINEAKKKNCIKINLEVASSNEVAINLYKKFRFEQVGIREGYYNGEDALLFTKFLN